MNSHSFGQSSLRYGLLLSTALTLALLAVPALSQDEVEQEIVVTGTRIARPEFSFSNPVTVLDGEGIQLSGRTNLVDLVQDLPALVNSSDSSDNSGNRAGIGATGLNLLDLRTLGVDRTLVLVDGRRHVGGFPGSSAVDTNSIPTDLIDQIQVSTGGASAIYGADAVTGVVNLILRHNFEGVETRIQGGGAAAGGFGEGIASALIGTNFLDDRANITLAIEASKSTRLHSTERDYLSSGFTTLVRNPFDGPWAATDDPAVPDRIFATDLRFFTSGVGGVVDTGGTYPTPFAFYTHNGDGSTYDPGVAIPNSGVSIGGSGTPVWMVTIGDLSPEIERVNINLLADFDVTDKLQLFGELKYSKVDVLSFSAPAFDGYIAISLDNPYIPANIRSDAVNFGFPSFLGGLGENYVYVERDHFDLGSRGEDIERETWRFVGGLKGDITDAINFEVSYVWNTSSQDTLSLNNRLEDRFFAAVDVVTDPGTGEPVCRSNLDASAVPPFSTFVQTAIFGPEFLFSLYSGLEPAKFGSTFTPGPNSGCVPANLFGEGTISPEAAAWITANTASHGELTQQVVTTFVAGDTSDFFELPAGAIGFSFGAEYRKEESEDFPNALDKAGLTFGNVLSDTIGAFDVSEAFLELNIPLLEGLPGVDELSIDGAVRVSNYDTIGDTLAWKYGGLWAPIPDIKFRGTHALAVRAPNIGELFTPASQSFFAVTDPCDQSSFDASPIREANCTTILGTFGIDPATFDGSLSATVPGLLAGNEDLSEETARTTTAGFVLQPRFLDGFAAAVDWYSVQIVNAIAFPDAQAIVDKCVDLLSLPNPFCSQMTRNSTTGKINFVEVMGVNVASFRTKGIDFTINYNFDLNKLPMVADSADWGTLNLHLVGNYLDLLATVPLVGEPEDHEEGLGLTDSGGSFTGGAPEWQATLDVTYEREDITLNYGISWFDETWRVLPENLARESDYVVGNGAKFPARWQHDLQVRYRVVDALEVYGGVNNLFDQEPATGAVAYPTSPIGRFFYVGFTTKFDDIRDLF